MTLLIPSAVSRTEDVPQPERGPKIGPEDLLPPDLMRAIHGVPLVLPELWKKHCAPTYQNWTRGMSENWPVLAAAIRLYVAPDEVLAERDARQWWVQWYRWQLAIDKDAPGVLGLFQGTEVQSNNYDGLNVGAILAVRLWALRNGHGEIVTLSAQWLSSYAALACLGAMAPWPAKIIAHGLGGWSDVAPNQRPNGPYRVQIGGRSTDQHYVDDPGSLLLGELLGWDRASHAWPSRHPWRYWPLQVSALLKGQHGMSRDQRVGMTLGVALPQNPENTDFAARFLRGLRFAGHVILRWPGAVAGMMPRLVNGNTAWVPASVLRAENGETVAEHAFPWPKPKPGNQESGRATRGPVALLAESAFGAVRLAIPAEPPTRVWVLDGTGCHEVSEARLEPTEPRPAPPQPPEPLAPGTDLESVWRAIGELRTAVRQLDGITQVLAGRVNALGPGTRREDS